MAGALVVGAFLSASLQVLFDRLASREVLSFIRGRKLNDKLLKMLERKLLVVHAVLNDAEIKQFTNPYVKKWLLLLKEAAYDAEDILDEIATEALRQKMETADQSRTSIISQVGKIIDVSSTLIRAQFDSQSIESRVEEIIDRLEDIARDKDDLGLKEGGVGEKAVAVSLQRWPSTSLVDESLVYGRDDEKEKMIELLLSDNINIARSCSTDHAIDVIAIVGMGGAGKTTLAQLLYNDQRVKERNCFDLEAWVCVSEEFDLIRVTKMTLEEIAKSTFPTNNLNQLQVELKDRVNSKKFLIVLDDVWNEDPTYWALLQTPLIVGGKGSKIVVTTRSTKVAAVMRAVYTLRLGQLSSEDSWTLFRKLAFENGDSNAQSQLEAIGKKIVVKCKGLPLAIKAAGSLLHSEVDARKWEEILDSQIWDMPTDTVLPALRLSYNYLPSHLKQCFAYCSLFPKDFEIEKKMLILLWMAEGLLEESKGKRRMEEVGESYFDELFSKSFFQNSIRMKETHFIMHDLVHDLAQLVSGEFIISLEKRRVSDISENTRHLSHLRRTYETFDRYGALSEFKYLRTFLLLDSYTFSAEYYLSTRVLHNVWSKIQFLRVLSLRGYKITDLPDSIGKLLHLRYLDLSFTLIRKLPASICVLYNLQTLILFYVRYLNELPSGIGNLINLRYLDVACTPLKEMPIHIGHLKCLQYLSNFIVGQKSGSGIGELKDLSDLRGTLEISRLENVKSGRDALEANLKDKRNLDELLFEWDEEASTGDDDDVIQNNIEDVIDNLHPHTNLKKLYITCFGGSRFPAWLGNPLFSNLRVLKIWSCTNCSALPPLGQLPSLEHLQIFGMYGIERVGCEFYHYENGNASSSITAIKPSFPSLRVLKFEHMENWEKWLWCGCRRGEFPRLRKLYMRYCRKLKGTLPKQLRCLKKLEIIGCPQLLVASLRTPAINELRMFLCGKLQVKRPAVGFTALRDSEIQISSISEWKQLAVGVHHLSIKECDSVETLIEDELLRSNTTTYLLESLEITYCCFSRSLDRVDLAATNALKSLSISHCSKLELLLPGLLRCHHPLLEYIYIRDNTSNSLSLSFCLSIFPRLHNFNISNLEGLEFLSISISEEDGPVSSLGHGYHIRIERCADLVYIGLPAVESARYLISRCRKLKLLALAHALPLSSLESLCLDDCPELLLHRDGLASSLSELQILSCNQLTSEQMDLGLQRLASLTTFTIGGGCQDVPSFPRECLLPSTITNLEIQHLPNLKSLDSRGLQHLISLTTLSISSCPELKSLDSRGLQHLTSLTTLSITSCPELESLTEAVEHLPNLKSLESRGLQYLTSLNTFSISRCPKLESLTEAGLQHLFSLETLHISDCGKLQFLTEGRLPNSLSILRIKKCPLLEDRCQFEKGQDWQYIAHIPHILINNQLY